MTSTVMGTAIQQTQLYNTYRKYCTITISAKRLQVFRQMDKNIDTELNLIALREAGLKKEEEILKLTRSRSNLKRTQPGSFAEENAKKRRKTKEKPPIPYAKRFVHSLFYLINYRTIDVVSVEDKYLPDAFWSIFRNSNIYLDMYMPVKYVPPTFLLTYLQFP